MKAQGVVLHPQNLNAKGQAWWHSSTGDIETGGYLGLLARKSGRLVEFLASKRCYLNKQTEQKQDEQKKTTQNRMRTSEDQQVRLSSGYHASQYMCLLPSDLYTQAVTRWGCILAHIILYIVYTHKQVYTQSYVYTNTHLHKCVFCWDCVTL